MAKTKIPTAAEVKEYLRQRDAESKARRANHEPIVVTGHTFPNEGAWLRGNTVPLLEAAERTGTPNEEIWKLCCKLSRMIHAPVAKKDYERMIPFAEKPKTVDAVIEFLETHTPQLSTFLYDVIGYYYCIALISQSDYRQADCERLLWKAVNHNIEQFKRKAEWSSLDLGTLHRNMKVLEGDRPYLTPMKEKLAEYLTDCN